MIKKQHTIKSRLEMREEMSCFKIRILYNFATRKEKYLPQAKFFSSILFIDSYRSRYFKQKLIIGLIRSFRLCKNTRYPFSTFTMRLQTVTTQKTFYSRILIPSLRELFQSNQFLGFSSNFCFACRIIIPCFLNCFFILLLVEMYKLFS